MENWQRKKDYEILIYKKEDYEKYSAAITALGQAKRASGWDRVQGVRILEDCRIPCIYHRDDMAIVMERDNGNGEYNIKTM